MDIPDLSLRSNFAPPFVKDQTSSTTCTMCKYTIYNLECDHPAEDRLETGDCSHFQTTGVPCDRENPAKRGRVSIKSEDRSGLCPKCHLRQREIAELEAMKRDEERAKKQALAEAKEKEAAMKKHEDNFLKEAAQEMARLEQEREEHQVAEALKRSQEEEEAVRLQREQDELAQALKASCVLDSEDTIIEPKRGQARADSVQLLSPPATPIRATPPARSPFVETPAKPVDYSLPAGQQEYGAYTLGGRRQPVHESQKQKAAKYLISTPSTPNSPAPIARLGSTIQPNSPSPRHVHTTSSPTPTPTDLRANLRRTGGPRKSMPSQSDAGTNPELDAFLARRRTWERNDETSSNVSITPSESASNLGTRPSSSGASDLSGASNKHDDSLIKNLDEKRRMGLRKD
ncbi:hypothetical protein FB567DRAFT_588953 [Paraphoma chrysanthemicola]|uniref:Uncharacterized protein n=1 Tax=Paraphoma chrysanthemicola TaxID=798071 RepID=A0A8K0RDY1_9PLEO|nr:hypothetical protein FB567DRAFT_588953 [Paraphoma chrysanthemicola]